jgi:tetratricopeptide (TPR) repeat protein
MPTAPTVFISYSHKDEVWKNRLLTHLRISEKEGLLELWDDRRIAAGTEWRAEIEKAIDAAAIGILLISADFLASDFIHDEEIPRMLEQRSKNGMRLFPVIVRACDRQVVPWLDSLQILPIGARPLAGFGGNRRDEEMATIAREVRGILDSKSAALPVPQTILAPLHQLPTPPADFTGREEDLDFLRSKLAQGGTGAIFGLRGMGGVGKTTLALKLADELKPRFPDAQIYLDLKGADPQPLTPAQAMAHVIRAFHPEARLPESEAELAALYRSVLDGKRALLLMDNAARKEQVEPLIPPSTSLLLVTSRFRFALPGLVDRDLDEMPEKDARDLLLAIAPRIGDAADEIARLCGRLALALRLAGSALAERPNLSPAEYARRFKEGKEKLGLVETALRTSYNLLTEEHQRLWRVLAVFPEAFNTQAVETVWELETDDAGSHLGELVRSSLVEWKKTDKRYRLHDLARAFAYAQITTAEKDESYRRYAEHFLEVLRFADYLYMQGDQEIGPGLSLFDLEWNNILVGQGWAAAQFKKTTDAADICSRYPQVGAHCLYIRQHPKDRIDWLETALAAARYLDDRGVEATHLANLGLAYLDLGDMRRAVTIDEQALLIFEEITWRQEEGSTLSNLGLAYLNLGDIRRAIDLYQQALVIHKETGDRRSEGTTLSNLGVAYSYVGALKLAVEFHNKALIFHRELGDRRSEGIDLGNLGSAYEALGDNEHAIETYKQQLDIALDISDRWAEANALGSLGSAYQALGEFERAIEYYQQALNIHRNVGDRRGESSDLGNLGNTFSNLGDNLRAIGLYKQQLMIDHEVGDRRGEATANWNLGLALEMEGDLVQASDLMQAHIDYLREIDHSDTEKNVAYLEALRARIAAQKP